MRAISIRWIAADWLVALLVAFEPVSSEEFPANWEIYWEIVPKERFAEGPTAAQTPIGQAFVPI